MSKNGKIEKGNGRGQFVVILERPKKGNKISEVQASYLAAETWAKSKTKNHPNRTATIYELVPVNYDWNERYDPSKEKGDWKNALSLIADPNETHDINTARLIADRALHPDYYTDGEDAMAFAADATAEGE